MHIRQLEYNGVKVQCKVIGHSLTAMDTPPLEDSHPVINMEDSLFPYLSQSLNQFLTSEPNHTHKKQATSILNGNNSDFEADSMPESQMELTEVHLNL